MKQSPFSEANSFSATQILSILWNPKVHYRVHKSPPPDRILNQFNPGQPQNSFLKINFNIIIPSTPGSSKLTPSVRFPHQNPVYTSPRPHVCYTSDPSRYSWFIHLNIWCSVQIMKLLITQFSPVPLAQVFFSTHCSRTSASVPPSISASVGKPLLGWIFNQGLAYLLPETKSWNCLSEMCVGDILCKIQGILCSVTALWFLLPCVIADICCSYLQV